MTPAELAYLVRFRTRTNASTFPSADILALANFYKDEFSKKLATTDGVIEVPKVADLVYDDINHVPQREYPFPASKISKIRRIEVKFASDESWVRLIPFDLGSYDKTTDEDTIVATFGCSQGTAYFDTLRQGFFIYSGAWTASVVGGLKIYVNEVPANFTDLTSTTDMSVDPTTTTLGFPRELHGSLLDAIVIAWKGSREKPIPLTESELKFQFDLNNNLNALRGQVQDEEVIGFTPSGSQLWNNGADL